MASTELTICLFALVSLVEGEVVEIEPHMQALELSKREKECLLSLKNESVEIQDDSCPGIWDGIMCWPTTEAGNLALQRCPSYINRFITDHSASRLCTENGSWYIPPFRNRSWTNYTMCSAAPKTIFMEHMRNLRLVYGIGYGLSLVSLSLAVIIMLYFKRLHCQRNSIHINLFISFILRAAISFMKETMLVQGVGFESDIRRTSDGIVFIGEGTHWQCKLFFTVFHYVLGSNYMWIFVEAFYLHSLISIAVFSESSGTKWYIIFGWTSALTFVLTWVAVRATKEDTLCWNTNTTPGYFWIMRGPILASTVLNFIFFVNVLRVLFTKLNAANSPEAQKFRKLAKSTLVLIPLFGIHYIIFGGIPDVLDEKTELVKLYFEMFFSSLQGFFVALLFCFLNSEVQHELCKSWQRYRIMHGGKRNSSHPAAEERPTSRVGSFSRPQTHPHFQTQTQSLTQTFEQAHTYTYTAHP